MTESDSSTAEEVLPADPIDADERERAMNVAADAAENGLLAGAAGLAAVLWAMRTSASNRVRSLAYAALGGLLVGVGLEQRRGLESDDEGDKETADDALAAQTPPEAEDRIADDESSEDALDEEGGPFTQAEGLDSSPAPDLIDEEGDPRRDEASDDAAVDLSSTAVADEPGEATGPDPEQAQPTRTEGTEPDPTPEEDASHLNAESDADDEGETDADDET